jgi:hypothetical protein
MCCGIGNLAFVAHAANLCGHVGEVFIPADTALLRLDARGGVHAERPYLRKNSRIQSAVMFISMTVGLVTITQPLVQTDSLAMHSSFCGEARICKACPSCELPARLAALID